MPSDLATRITSRSALLPPLKSNPTLQKFYLPGREFVAFLCSGLSSSSIKTGKGQNVFTCVYHVYTTKPILKSVVSSPCVAAVPSMVVRPFVRVDEEKAAIKKHESKFITMEPQAMYTIDRINNGLYR